MHQFQLEPIHWQKQKHAFKDIHPSMEELSNNHKDCSNQHENSYRLCNETGHPVFCLMKRKWKLRQSHDPNFPMEGKPL